MFKTILVVLVLSFLTLTAGCRTYRFELTDPVTKKTVSFNMTHWISDTEAGKITFRKTKESEWVVEIENLHTTQKLAATIDSLATLLSKVAVPATAAVPAFDTAEGTE